MVGKLTLVWQNSQFVGVSPGPLSVCVPILRETFQYYISISYALD